MAFHTDDWRLGPITSLRTLTITGESDIRTRLEPTLLHHGIVGLRDREHYYTLVQKYSHATRRFREILDDTLLVSTNTASRTLRVSHKRQNGGMHSINITERRSAWITAADHLRNYTSEYNNAATSDLFASVERLPRELRDRIFETLIQVVWEEQNGSTSMGSLSKKPWETHHSQPIYCPRDTRGSLLPPRIPFRFSSSHLWNKSFVRNPRTRREMVEAFYRTIHFDLNPNCITSLQTILKCDEWDTGVTPADRIRKVVIETKWSWCLSFAANFHKRTELLVWCVPSIYKKSRIAPLFSFREEVVHTLSRVRSVRADGYRVRIFIEQVEMSLNMSDEEIGEKAQKAQEDYHKSFYLSFSF